MATSRSTRRALLRSLLCASVAAAAPAVGLAAATPLPPWREGEFHLHHLDTGRGNCAILICPDGTSVMIDAGAADAPPATTSDARPDASRRPGQWIARYALRILPQPRLDFFIATHLHGDHIGSVDASNPLAPTGAYRLSGITDVATLLPVGTVIDRGFPAYTNAAAPTDPSARNYIAYLQSRIAAGLPVECAQVGSTTQIHLRQPDRYPGFQTRILSANSVVWNPETQQPVARVSDPAQAARAAENSYSLATRWKYGRFSYYSGGDVNFDTHDGRDPQLDIESPVALAAGPTDVAVANHHAYFDACGPNFVRALDAQALIIPAWDVGHPGNAQIQRLLGDWPDAAKHDVFATDILPANALVNRRFVSQLKSRRGHIVVRVANGGHTFTIHTVDSSREAGDVLGNFGPYISRT